ncbi:MAG TPA: aromatic ring-hydroxylating dioxygenase subunit alpha [Methylomirabilota bacterium]|nr:aromatic ring-hydroxylating dioxygenase subunit alpha [Methylomirabilota bacterium]
MDVTERALVERLWFPVARSEDLAGSRVVAGRLLETDLVVFRTDAGLAVAEDRCPHRGAALSRGQVMGDELQCAYHGWRFRGDDGRCTHVPSLPGGAPPRTGLALCRAAERYGFVWCCLGEPVLEVPVVHPLEAGSWQTAVGSSHDLHCGYRQLTENFSDTSHFPFVHRRSMGPNVQREVPRYQVERDGWALRWTIPTDLGGTAFGGNDDLAAKQTLTYHVVLPSVAFVHTTFPDGGQRITLQLAAPLGAGGDWCRQFWAVAIDPIAARHPEGTLEDQFRYEKLIFEEDWPVIETQRPREAPLDGGEQAHTRADQFSLVYRKAYVELMALASATPARAT